MAGNGLEVLNCFVLIIITMIIIIVIISSLLALQQHWRQELCCGVSEGAERIPLIPQC